MQASEVLRAEPDTNVFAYAYESKRVLITQDTDFGELAVFHELPHCGILPFRRMLIQEVLAALPGMINRHEDMLNQGAIISISLRGERAHILN